MPDIRILLVMLRLLLDFLCLPYSFLDIFIEEKLGLRPSRQRALREW